MSKNNHNSPVYIVSGAVYFFLWYMLMNGLLVPDQAPIGVRIAVPLLAYGGVLLNLLFCWIWSRLFNKTNKNKTDDDDEQGSIEETVASPSIEAVEDVELADKRSQEESSSRDACQMDEAKRKAEAKRAEAKAKEKAEKKINRMLKEIESYNESGKFDTLPTTRSTRLEKRDV